MYETVEQCTKTTVENLEGEHEYMSSWDKIYGGLKANEKHIGLAGTLNLHNNSETIGTYLSSSVTSKFFYLKKLFFVVKQLTEGSLNK